MDLGSERSHATAPHLITIDKPQAAIEAYLSHLIGKPSQPQSQPVRSLQRDCVGRSRPAILYAAI